MVRAYGLLVILLGMSVASAGAGGGKDAPKKPPEKKGPLELRLVAHKSSYPLDLGGKTPQQFKKLLAAAAKMLKGGPEVPPAPEVDLTLEIHNPTDKEQTAYVGGDYLLKLDLKGPGAMCIRYGASYTTDIKKTREIKIGAGQSHALPLKRLEHGFRGYGERCYWTEPGEYTLTAAYGSRGGVGQTMNLTSAPVKLQVTKK